MAKPLDFNAGPLVWVDCEMTGLDPRTDKIIEIAVLITNGNLELVDEGLEFVIRTDKADLDRMGEWCTKQHGQVRFSRPHATAHLIPDATQSGLTKACLESPHSHENVTKAVLAYIKKWIPQQRVGVLAGNSVHADRSFLVEAMPEVVDWLHYRSLFPTLSTMYIC
ncbi:hypothetical protein DXG03_001478 [Asterophora parasitica]|uniref:Exonuclease domain-containing protein n=1 Tax=Asterophora parasitica TaxID=117018 RepID=A0A9P7GHB5_9AGAR|nr:hypothetical protein DXG03_001478 [Asterophora parasitica]